MPTKSKVAQYTLLVLTTLISYTSFIVKYPPSFGQIDAENIELKKLKNLSNHTRFIAESIKITQGSPPAMEYAGCVDLEIGESRSVCPRNK
ncbi:MAG: hypothetical protein RID09_17440 [Coleofasciculus sp. G1-WW12-02]|uniref:hypothetical protein n=1 Tax=Coleofasciculus sp. G1-WW12-02 TaxID=3068483 RepID=UPI0032F7BB63